MLVRDLYVLVEIIRNSLQEFRQLRIPMLANGISAALAEDLVGDGGAKFGVFDV